MYILKIKIYYELCNLIGFLMSSKVSFTNVKLQLLYNVTIKYHNF